MSVCELAPMSKLIGGHGTQIQGGPFAGPFDRMYSAAHPPTNVLPPMQLLIGGTAATVQGEPYILDGDHCHMFTAAHSSRKNLPPRALRGVLDSGAFTDPPHKRLTPDRVVNLYALRATDPAAPSRATDPVGLLNDSFIRVGARETALVVCGWGAHPIADKRARLVCALIDEAWQAPSCPGVTRDGYPRHPLYVPRHPLYVPRHPLYVPRHPLYVRGDTALEPFTLPRKGVRHASA